MTRPGKGNTAPSPGWPGARPAAGASGPNSAACWLCVSPSLCRTQLRCERGSSWHPDPTRKVSLRVHSVWQSAQGAPGRGCCSPPVSEACHPAALLRTGSPGVVASDPLSWNSCLGSHPQEPTWGDAGGSDPLFLPDLSQRSPGAQGPCPFGVPSTGSLQELHASPTLPTGWAVLPGRGLRGSPPNDLEEYSRIHHFPPCHSNPSIPHRHQDKALRPRDPGLALGGRGQRVVGWEAEQCLPVVGSL